jgi:endonuclease III
MDALVKLAGVGRETQTSLDTRWRRFRDRHVLRVSNRIESRRATILSSSNGSAPRCRRRDGPGRPTH